MEAPLENSTARSAAVLPELLLLAGFIPLAAASWSAILLAELGAFTGWRVLACAAVITLGAWLVGWRELSSAFRSRIKMSWGTRIWIAVTLAVAVVCVSHPGECLIDARDASVYLAVGRTIERTGGMVSVDPLSTIVSADVVRPLLARSVVWPHELIRFPGGLLASSDMARVIPEFHPLLPAWIATMSALAGPAGGYAVNQFFGVFGVFALWLVGRRAWSPATGAIAAALLSVSYGQIVYSRLTFSEIPAQFLLLAALDFTMLASDRQSRLAAACAGVAVGLAAFTRIDALAVLVPLTVAFLVFAKRRNLLGPAWRWYAMALAFVGGHAAAHALLVSRLYTLRLAATAWRELRIRSTVTAGHMILVTAVIVVAVGIAVAIWRRGLAGGARARGLLLLAGIAATLAVLAPAAIGMMRQLLSTAGVTAALSGLCVVLCQEGRLRSWLVLAPFLSDLLLFGTWPEAAGLSTDFRRLVPSILPIALLMVGVLVSAALGSRRRVLRVALALPAGLAAFWLWQALPILRAPPLEYVHRQVAAVASRLPANAVVISDSSVPSHLTLALQSTFGRTCLPLVDRPSSSSSIRAFIDEVLATGRPVFVLIGPYQGEIPHRLWRNDLGALDVDLAGVERLQYTKAAPVLSGFPRPLPVLSTRVELYRTALASERPGVALPAGIDVGDVDFQWLLDGFYGPESMSSARARWTSGRARVLLPRVAPSGSPITLLLRLAAYRPAGLTAPAVRVSIDGVPAGSIDRPGPAFATYQITLDGGLAARLRSGRRVLTIDVDTFVPRVFGVGTDARALGVALDWIRLE